MYLGLGITNLSELVKMEHKLDYLIRKMIIWIFEKSQKTKTTIRKYI